MSDTEYTFKPLPHDSDTYILDVNMFDTPGFGAVYLIDDGKKALIETGTSVTAPRLQKALEAHGVGEFDLDYIIVSHIHLDHAGGAGELVKKFKNAKVIVHERGAKHLANPSRLVESAKVALAGEFRYYGEMTPIPPEKIISASGGESIDLCGRTLDIIYTPGHAPHHISIHDRKSKVVYTGDAAGLYFPADDMSIPTTPLPRFDLEQTIESLKSIAALGPKRLIFSHFGHHGEPAKYIADHIATLGIWKEFIEKLEKKGLPFDKILTELCAAHCRGIEHYTPEFIKARAEASLRGFLGYLKEK